MKSADFVKAHDRVKDFDWQASYREPSSRYDMPYKIPTKTSDPFRHLVRDYCSMERDKDDRQYEPRIALLPHERGCHDAKRGRPRKAIHQRHAVEQDAE